jgi:hypothetical protein
MKKNQLRMILIAVLLAPYKTQRVTETQLRNATMTTDQILDLLKSEKQASKKRR